MICKYGDVWLTGTPWQEGCGEVEWSAEQAVEITALIGAATPRVVGRGNVQDSVPVPITLSFQTAEGALRYCAELPWLLPADGALRFEEGDTIIVFPKAAFKDVKRQRRGTSVDLLFEFAVTGPPVFPGVRTYALNNTLLEGFDWQLWDTAWAANDYVTAVEVSCDFTRADDPYDTLTRDYIALLMGNGGTGVPPTIANFYDTQTWADGIVWVGGQINNPPFTDLDYAAPWPVEGPQFLANTAYQVTAFNKRAATPAWSSVDLADEQIPLLGKKIYVGNSFPGAYSGRWTGHIKIYYAQF